ncbi:MAG TPA: DAK2 domain-containing protein, partial [Syntrophomonadaceae bacterium]|nr:DAK2 domain-containing protein [Syntrophomonadaceae bacterium]
KLSLVYITGRDLVRTVKAGCINLEHNRDKVDLLNVFPVPDGDTGTNMYLTLLSAVKEGEKHQDESLGKVAKAISMGSLMGARGNSGVILSQIFRGLAKTLEGNESASAADLALALKAGADTAYKAVMKPVEGTILTVIREIARRCENEAKKQDDIVAVLMAGIQTGQEVLKRTPTMLPILKEAGVVDSGGQGLIYFLEGAVEGLAQEKDIALDVYREKSASANQLLNREIDIEFMYCTEVLIKGSDLQTDDIQDHLAPLGDSMLVVGGDDIVKVHIHSNHPGKVLETCLQFGTLSDIKINNMVEETHEHLNNWAELENRSQTSLPVYAKNVGLVAVGSGDGIIEILKSLGVDQVVEGGQTMNPSTEDLLHACEEIDAPGIIILPNNGNIIMAARQVPELIDKKIEIVATKSVMQAVTALVAYDPAGDLEKVAMAMDEEMQVVKYAEVTHAVRNTTINGLDIKEGNIIGMINGDIEVVGNEPAETVTGLLRKMVDEDSELITIFYGDDISEEEAMALKQVLEEPFNECELEIHYGGQPHYSYLLSVE